MPSLGKFESIILCDDVRREDNGKTMLIGVYSGNVVVSDAPASIPLKIYAHYSVGELGEQPLNFILKFNGVVQSRIDGTVRQDIPDAPIALNLPPFDLNVTEPGYLEVEASNGDEQRVVLKRRIDVQPKSLAE